MSSWTILRGVFTGGSFARALTLVVCVCSFSASFPLPARAQAPEGPAPAPVAPPQQATNKPVVFKVKYVSEGSAYIDAGCNSDLQEGMKLSVVEALPDGVIAEGIQYRGYPHVAELVISSVSDSSAVCDVAEASGELKVGQAAFLTAVLPSGQVVTGGSNPTEVSQSFSTLHFQPIKRHLRSSPVHPIPVPILLVFSSQQIRSAHAEPVVSGFEIGCR